MLRVHFSLSTFTVYKGKTLEAHCESYAQVFGQKLKHIITENDTSRLRAHRYASR